jgi:glutaredoxin-like protein
MNGVGVRVGHDVTGTGSDPSASPPSVEVYWRPGCPYCLALRIGLKRARIPTTRHNIWTDPEAAARVRSVAGGNETVPTVFVGDVALVNPSVREIKAVLAAGA